MLLNLSNHPSSTWPEKQIQVAEEAYGQIQDMAFPPIDPEADESYVRKLAERYLADILKLQPKAVHLMGELTFCFDLVQLLHAHRIPVLASTTHRTTEDLPNGSKVSKFEFVRFRSYGL